MHTKINEKTIQQHRRQNCSKNMTIWFSSIKIRQYEIEQYHNLNNMYSIQRYDVICCCLFLLAPVVSSFVRMKMQCSRLIMTAIHGECVCYLLNLVVDRHQPNAINIFRCSISFVCTNVFYTWLLVDARARKYAYWKQCYCAMDTMVIQTHFTRTHTQSTLYHYNMYVFA